MSARVAVVFVALLSLWACESADEMKARTSKAAHESVPGSITPSYADPARHVVCYAVGYGSASSLSCVYVPPTEAE